MEDCKAIPWRETERSFIHELVKAQGLMDKHIVKERMGSS